MIYFQYKIKNPVKKKIRIDLFLKENFIKLNILISRNFIKKTINQVKINNKTCLKVNSKIKFNDNIEYTLYADHFKYLNPFFKIKHSINIPTLYEDSFLLIIDKPKNMIVHPAISYNNWSLLHYVQDKLIDFKKKFIEHLHHQKNFFFQLDKPENFNMIRPGVIHRIDELTSGILILAKKENSLKQGIQMFKKRKISKYYLAIVKGIPKKKDKWIDFIGRDPNNRKKFKIGKKSLNPKIAITAFQRIHFSKEKNLSLIKIKLITGRTHQIRCHFAHYQFLLAGDPLYGKLDFKFEKKQLALLAYKVKFMHPITKKIIKIKSSQSKKFIYFYKEIILY